jgi:hypothetical protein
MPRAPWPSSPAPGWRLSKATRPCRRPRPRPWRCPVEARGLKLPNTFRPGWCRSAARSPSNPAAAWPQRTMPLEAQNALARHHTTDTSGRAHSRSRHCGPKKPWLTNSRDPNAKSKIHVCPPCPPHQQEGQSRERTPTRRRPRAGHQGRAGGRRNVAERHREGVE